MRFMTAALTFAEKRKKDASTLEKEPGASRLVRRGSPTPPIARPQVPGASGDLTVGRRAGSETRAQPPREAGGVRDPRPTTGVPLRGGRGQRPAPNKAWHPTPYFSSHTLIVLSSPPVASCVPFGEKHR